MCVYNISDIICNLKQVHQWTCENIPRSFITLKLNQYHRKLEQQSFDVLACSTKSIKRFIYTRLKIFLHIVNHFDQISNFQPCELYDHQTLFSNIWIMQNEICMLSLNVCRFIGTFVVIAMKNEVVRNESNRWYQ